MSTFKHIAISAFLLSIFCTTNPVHARHLGPIVFGQERVEEVTICFDRDDALFYFEQARESFVLKETHDKSFERVALLATERRCVYGSVQYTPLKTLRQVGPLTLTPEERKACQSDDGTIRLALCDELGRPFSLVEAVTWDKKTIYIIPLDGAPPPE